MKKILLAAVFITACSTLSGCIHNVSPNTYTNDEVGIASRVNKGVIVSKRVIKIESTSGVGGIAGAAGGAAAGSAIGSGGAANVVGAVGGAVAVGVVGHEIDKAVNRKTGYEYIIKLDNGKTVAVAQERSIHLAVGQHVLIIYGAMTRVVPDETTGK
ncbi:MAG: hypothetical protein KKE11_03315 [Gammaproteobacteria bacterium]|nr:hypothetical protein [Gammaproteobacteria bacterium]